MSVPIVPSVPGTNGTKREREKFGWSPDFDWEWYLCHLGLSVRRADNNKHVVAEPFETDWISGNIHELEEIVEFRIDWGADVYTREEMENWE